MPTSNRPPLELFGDRTGNCMRVAIALEEAEVPYALTRVELGRGAHREAWFTSLNPAGQVPLIIDRVDPDHPFVLSQSNAILLFIASRAPGRLLPEDDQRRAIALERFFYFLMDAIGWNYSAFFLRQRGHEQEADLLDQQAISRLEDAERFLVDGGPTSPGPRSRSPTSPRSPSLGSTSAGSTGHDYPHCVAGSTRSVRVPP